MNKRLYRSSADRMISGVCGGLADYFAIDPTIVRLAAVALLFVTSGLAVVVYIVMAIVVPDAPAEGEPDSPRAMTGDEISAGAQGFARDVKTAATKVVGGSAAAPETAPDAAPAAETPSETTTAPAVPTPERRSGNTGAILIGVLLVAFGLLMFASRIIGVDLVAVGWKLLVPGVIIVLGVLILVRAARVR